MIRTVVSFVALLCFVACQAQSTQRMPTAPNALTQWSGAYGGGTAASHRVIRDAAAWSALWKELGREAPRPLDVARESAVFIFVGERRSGGFNVEVVNIAPHDGKLVVTYRETTPPSGTMVTQALTAPWTVAIVPRSDLPLVVRSSASDRPVAPSSK